MKATDQILLWCICLGFAAWCYFVYQGHHPGVTALVVGLVAMTIAGSLIKGVATVNVANRTNRPEDK